MASFSKYAVCGNDFILMENVGDRPDLSARRLCCRRFGIGADQLVTVNPQDDGRYRVTIWNPDGSQSPFCGNALLAVGAFVAEQRKGMAAPVTLVAGDIAVPFFTRNGQPTIALPQSRITPVPAERCRVAGSLGEMQVACGTYHYVVVVEDLDSIDVPRLGALLEHGARPGGTTNVIFTQRLANRELRIAPWERGGSGATLACGSGAYSAAAVAAALNNPDNAARTVDEWTVHCPGGPLSVQLGPAQSYLSGQPVCTFSGTLAQQSIQE